MSNEKTNTISATEQRTLATIAIENAGKHAQANYLKQSPESNAAGARARLVEANNLLKNPGYDKILDESYLGDLIGQDALFNSRAYLKRKTHEGRDENIAGGTAVAGEVTGYALLIAAVVEGNPMLIIAAIGVWVGAMFAAIASLWRGSAKSASNDKKSFSIKDVARDDFLKELNQLKEKGLSPSEAKSRAVANALGRSQANDITSKTAANKSKAQHKPVENRANVVSFSDRARPEGKAGSAREMLANQPEQSRIKS